MVRRVMFGDAVGSPSLGAVGAEESRSGMLLVHHVWVQGHSRDAVGSSCLGAVGAAPTAPKHDAPTASPNVTLPRRQHQT